MATLTLEKPYLHEKELFLYLLEIMQDLEDNQNVKNEMLLDDGYRVDFDNFLKNV